jgi:arylsulfatase A-like enzyme
MPSFNKPRRPQREDFLTTSRRQFLAAGPGGALACPPRRRPNVIVILTDDQGYGDLACHGNPVLKTPHLDRLHGESTRFTNFHSEPLCAPTRAALLTGRYPFRNSVTVAIGGWGTLRPGVKTAADLFGEHGYRTAAFGKWHLGDNAPYRPFERGFQETLCFRSGGLGSAGDWWGNDNFDDTYLRRGRPEKQSGYSTDIWFTEGLRFIEANREQPFFLYLAPNAPHDPFLVSDRYAEPYRKLGLPRGRAEFYGMIANLDENIGRLRAHLARLGLAGNTILVFMTDNGTTGGFEPRDTGPARGFNAGMRGKKSQLYEGGHRVPLFLHWPDGGIGAGADVHRLAAHIDVLPTLMDLAGLSPPRNTRFDGLSLRPLIYGSGGFPVDRIHYVQHMQFAVDGRFQADHPRPFANCCVLSDRWRLINGKELYDMQADPAQEQDIAAANPEVVSKLCAHYERHWDDISEGLRQPVSIPLGTPAENPTRLTGFDWHTERWIAWPRDIAQAKPGSGYWEVEIPAAGRYRLDLRQQPEEAPCPIQGTQARIRVGPVDRQQAIAPGTEVATFDLSLPAGRTRLQTWFAEDRGAYYVYARRH